MTHASVFSGIGGPEVAAAMLGWRNVFHCEINPFGRKVLEYWFPESDSYADITKTDFTIYRGKVDVLTGGFPCQPFSYAGKRGGQADDRYLWPEMFRVINEVRPTWVVCENVAGITTMVESCEITDMGGEASLFEEDNGVHRFRAEYAFTIERICRDLESKGYSVQPVLIPACSVGAPHRRDRVFIIAHTSSCGSESHTQDGRAESDGSREFPQQSQWREQAEFDNGFSVLSRFVADSDSRRGGEILQHIQSELSDGAESFCYGRVGNVADTQNLFINGSETRYRGNDLKKRFPNLEVVIAKMLPTPRANKVKDVELTRALSMRNKSNLEESVAKALHECCLENDGKGLRLSPLFTEEMMGFPLMWTALPFLSQSGRTNH